MLLADNLLNLYPWLPGVVVAVVLTTAGWLITYRYRQRDRKSKTLDYQVVSDIAILNHRPEDSGLSVTYLGEELDNPRVVRVRVQNTGSEVIRAGEILEPYSLGVGASWLVSVGMAEQSAPSLASFEAVAGPCTHAVKLHLNTLNPGDEFTLQLLLDTKDDADISIAGRIEGQTRPSSDMAAQIDARTRVKNRWRWAAGLAWVVAGVAIALLQPHLPHWTSWMPGLFCGIGFGVVTSVWTVSVSRKVQMNDGVLNLKR